MALDICDGDPQAQLLQQDLKQQMAAGRKTSVKPDELLNFAPLKRRLKLHTGVVSPRHQKKLDRSRRFRV